MSRLDFWEEIGRYREALSIDFSAMTYTHDVDDKPFVSYARNHSPVANAILPVSCPSTGQGLAELARIGRSDESVVDESLNAPLDRPIKRKKFVPRRGMKLNVPGQAAS